MSYDYRTDAEKDVDRLKAEVSRLEDARDRHKAEAEKAKREAHRYSGQAAAAPPRTHAPPGRRTPRVIMAGYAWHRGEPYPLGPTGRPARRRRTLPSTSPPS